MTIDIHVHARRQHSICVAISVSHRSLLYSLFKAVMLHLHFRLAVLYKRCDHGMGGYCCSAFKPAAEVATESEYRLCKRECQHGGIGL